MALAEDGVHGGDDGIGGGLIEAGEMVADDAAAFVAVGFTAEVGMKFRREGEGVHAAEGVAEGVPIVGGETGGEAILPFDIGIEHGVEVEEGDGELTGGGGLRGDDGGEAVGVEEVGNVKGHGIERGAAELDEPIGGGGVGAIDGGVGVCAEGEEGEAGDGEVIVVVEGGDELGVGEGGFVEHVVRVL